MLIRGEMSLAKLRDKIFCPYDYFSNRYDFEDASNIVDYYVVSLFIVNLLEFCFTII